MVPSFASAFAKRTLPRKFLREIAFPHLRLIGLENGILDRADLVHIWRPPEHTEEHLELYMSILEKFEARYP
jgi:hypothetical protein